MMGSWRTSLGGKLVALGTLLAVAGGFVSGTISLESLDWGGLLAAIGVLTGAGGAAWIGLVARDNKVSSEEAGAVAIPKAKRFGAAHLNGLLMPLVACYLLFGTSACVSAEARVAAAALEADFPVLIRHIEPREELTAEQRQDVTDLIEIMSENVRRLAEELR